MSYLSPTCRNQEYHEPSWTFPCICLGQTLLSTPANQSGHQHFPNKPRFSILFYPNKFRWESGKWKKGEDSDGFGEWLWPFHIEFQPLKNPSHSAGVTLPGRKTKPLVMAWVSLYKFQRWRVGCWEFEMTRWPSSPLRWPPAASPCRWSARQCTKAPVPQTSLQSPAAITRPGPLP